MHILFKDKCAVCICQMFRYILYFFVQILYLHCLTTYLLRYLQMDLRYICICVPILYLHCLTKYLQIDLRYICICVPILYLHYLTKYLQKDLRYIWRPRPTKRTHAGPSQTDTPTRAVEG